MEKKQVKISNIYPIDDGNYAIILSDIDDKYSFLITTVKTTVAYIVMYQLKKIPPRPSIYDVFLSFLSTENYILKEICITNKTNSIFQAEISYSIQQNPDGLDNSIQKRIPLKATDAIILALASSQPLYAPLDLIKSCHEDSQSTILLFNKKFNSEHTIKSILEKQLKEAINCEDYERAAILKKRIDGK